MASTINPVLAMQDPSALSLMPGRNPTGGSGASTATSVPMIGSSSGANPYAMSPIMSTSPSAPITTNPFGGGVTSSGGGIPSFGANSGPYSPTSLAGSGTPATTQYASAVGAPPGSYSGSIGGFGNLSESSLQSLSRALARTFGAGDAQAIMAFLGSGAGFNQDAINNLFAALQPGYNRAQQDLLQQFSTGGNRFSSGAQIGVADLLSQQQLNEGQIESSLYESSVQDYINTLLSVSGTNSQRIANSPSTFDSILQGLNLGGSAVGGISSLASAINPSADTSILDAIASLGAI